jgi:hypothetical protein
VLTVTSSGSALRRWHIKAGAATYHHLAGDGAHRSPRHHAYPPRRRPHRPLHSVHDRLSSCCVNLRIVLRIDHLLVEGACVGFSVASSPLAQPSPLCRSAHLLSPPSAYPTTIQGDGPGLRGERAQRHSSCQCQPPGTVLTRHVHSTIVVPTGHDAAASVAGIGRRTGAADHDTARRPGDHATDVDTRVSRRRMSARAPHLRAHGIGARASDTGHQREDHYG